MQGQEKGTTTKPLHKLVRRLPAHGASSILPFKLLVVPSALPGAADVGDAMSERKNLADFRGADLSEWYVINDGVMGGVSRSDIRPTGNGTGVFSGVLSLENNGGFASVRSRLGHRDLSEYAGLEIRVRGDGRTYQLRLRTDDRFDGIAYRVQFETLDGEWITIQIPFDKFLPTFRGKTPTDVQPLDTSSIHQMGFMLADKTPGTFSLEIEFVRAWDSATIAP